VSPRIQSSNEPSNVAKYVSEKAIGFENENQLKEMKKNVFQKCRSRSSQGTSDEMPSNDEEVFDDVFDSKPSTMTRATVSTSTSGNCNKKRSKKPRSSSLESANKKNSFKKISNSSARNSSVSINDNPEYFEYNKATNSSNIASSSAIAKLRTKPSRGSLKKTPNSSTSSMNKNNDKSSSEYRTRNPDGGHRDSFKKNDRTNERVSDPNRDLVKDGHLNRSLSNTDTNLEDRIGN
jgi:hypothetical protein